MCILLSWDGRIFISSQISFGDSSGLLSPVQKANTGSMSRTFSSPGNFDAPIDRPMRLAEIFVAAEHALRNTISDEELWKCLSSVTEFEVIGLQDLTFYRSLLFLVYIGLLLKFDLNGCAHELFELSSDFLV